MTPLVGKQEDVLVVEVELIGQMILMRSGVDVLLKVDWWNRCVRNTLPRCTTCLSLCLALFTYCSKFQMVEREGVASGGEGLEGGGGTKRRVRQNISQFTRALWEMEFSQVFC